MEEAVAELDSNVKTSVDKIQTELESVKAEVYRCNNDAENSNKLFEEIKVELCSVKGLLLNRYVNNNYEYLHYLVFFS